MRSLPRGVSATIRTRRSSALSNPADQALPDEAIDSNTDRAWGQIYDWAYRVDGQRPFAQQEYQHAEVREAESGLLDTSGCVPGQDAHRFHH
jgi:hypothetical protein